MRSPFASRDERKRAADSELDSVLRWFMHDQVGHEEPSDAVWQRIRARVGLEGGPVAFPKPLERPAPRRAVWLQMASVAVVFLIAASVVFGGHLHSVQSSVSEDTPQSALDVQCSEPVVMTRDDIPTGRLTHLNRQQDIKVRRGLDPTRDPLLVNRHWEGGRDR